LRVMSELLRSQHCDNQVDQQGHRDEEPNDGVDPHQSPHFISRSQTVT
jgi:hypothetical protein